jgi:hypothetical protein
MNRTFLAVLAFLGTLAFLALFLADREMQASLERLSGYKFPPRSARDEYPGLRLASTHSRYIRTELWQGGGPRQADNSVLEP